MRVAIAVAALLVAASPAAAQTTPVEEGVRQQSCNALAASTVGLPDQAPAPDTPGIDAPWPEATVALPASVPLRTPTTTFNRRYEFVTAQGAIYGRDRESGDPWRAMPLPACFAGRVRGISLDDDELIALDASNRIYTMDGALKPPTAFSWSSRWGTPFWTGLGYSLPGGIKAWSWSVVSPLEDRTWKDPAGNRTAIGAGKVSHIWGLRTGGRRITFWDPWLPLDESYEMCGPHRGRFRSVNLSASGSYVFVIGPRGDLFTRPYDFDLSGHDPIFFSYSYEDQRGKGDGAPIQLPAEPWTEQPKIPGRITDAISIHKVGPDLVHRVLRVEGRRRGRTGYWESDIADPGWKFVATGLRLTGRALRNPRRDTSARRFAPPGGLRYRLRRPGLTVELSHFEPYCSPARVRVREQGRTRTLRLHHVDGLRQQARGRGLDDTPREQSGALEGPRGTFEPVTLQATRAEVVLQEQGWTLRRVRAAARGAARRRR